MPSLSYKISTGEFSASTRNRAANSGVPQDDSQQTLEDSFPSTSMLPTNSRRAKDITNAIGYFVAKDTMPISTTEGVGFKHLMRVLELRYAILGMALPQVTN